MAGGRPCRLHHRADDSAGGNDDSVDNPGRFLEVENAIHPGDDLRLTTREGAIYVFFVTRVDAGTVYGMRDKQTYQVAFGDIARMEIHRQVRPGTGGGSGNIHHSSGGGGGGPG